MCVCLQAKDVYTERSPITHAANLKVPVVFFQGTEDRVVPPDQATRMYEIVKSKGLAVRSPPPRPPHQHLPSLWCPLSSLLRVGMCPHRADRACHV